MVINLKTKNFIKQIKQLEQQQKQIEQSMFDENEKLRQELIQAKMLLEQQQQTSGIVKKQSSTIVLTNLVSNDQNNFR